MNILTTAVRACIKRPFIIIFFALLMFVYMAVNLFNPVITFVIGVISITRSGLFESVVSALQAILNPAFIPILLLVLIGLALVVSLLAGLLLPGIMHILDTTLRGREKEHGEYRHALVKLFGRILLMTLRATVIIEALGIFLMVSCVPAAVVTRAAFSDKPDLLMAAVFVDILTVIVLFFGLMFSRAYIFFWYPAAIRGERKPFPAGKKHVDENFWGIAGRLFVFDLVFTIFQVFIYLLNNVAAQFIVGWLFGTVFLTCLMVYIFGSYNKDDDMEEASQAE